MSRNIHWQIPFKSLNGDEYTIKIYDEGWTGNITTFEGGARPFEVQEDDNEDFFTPVRYQSGYFRITCDDTTWQALIPTDGTAHLVKLYKKLSAYSEVVVWFGYQKAESYSHTLWQYRDEYEFPIVCPLTMLKSAQWNLASGFNTLEELINEMFALVGLDSIYYIEYPNCYVSNLRNKVLGMRISRLHFIEFNDDYLPGSTNPSKQCVWKQTKTPADVLENICAMLGWCCHFEEGNISFSAVDVNNMIDDTCQVPVLYHQVGNDTYKSFTVEARELDDNDICSAENMGISAPNYSEVVITADPDEMDVELSLPSMDELIKGVDFFTSGGWWQGWDAGQYDPGNPDPNLKFWVKQKEFGLVGQQVSGPWIAPGIWSRHFKNGWIATQHDVNDPIYTPDYGNEGGYDSAEQDFYEGQDTDDRYDYDYDWDDGWVDD